MLDKKNKRLVEFNSTHRFNIEAVIKAKKYEQVFDFRKYCNDDLNLLEQNMTPHQFEQIETTYLRSQREHPAEILPHIVEEQSQIAEE
jgi:hypothetical protein